MQRADQIPQNAGCRSAGDVPGKYVRNININFNQWSSFNFDGRSPEPRRQLQRALARSRTSGGRVRRQRQRRRLRRPADPRRPRRPVNGNVNSWQYFNTNDRQACQLGWNSNFGNDRLGSRGSTWSRAIVVRPASAFSAEFGIAYNNSIDDAQWVTSVGDSDGSTHYVFGRLAQKTTSLTTRFNYTLSPTLSLQVYAQPFVSAGVYDGYKELVSRSADHYPDRYAPFDYAGNADFNVLSFRTTNVLRWEFKPGSAFFVVWQQGREGFTQQRQLRLRARLRRPASTRRRPTRSW